MLSDAAPRLFLSYARRDGEAFATALRRRLTVEEPGLTIWQDRTQMEGGIGWWRQIEAALDQVQFLVVVMTPHAFESEVTLAEWRYARQRGVHVYPVKGVPDNRLDYARLPNWMRKAHMFDVGQFADGEWRNGREWDTFVQYLKSDRALERVPFMAPDLPEGFVQRPREFDRLLQILLKPLPDQSTTEIASVHGAGGYGKTTLAIAVCHDERIIDTFDDGVLWTSLGQSPDLTDSVASLYQALTGQVPAFTNVAYASSRLAEKLEHRHCLIVVDDVWDRAQLEPFVRGGPHCARLITTRRADLSSRARRIHVDEMDTMEATRVLAGAVGPAMVPSGTLEALARRLGEWPLLLRLAAGMLRRRLDRGESVEGALAYVTQALHKRGVIAFDRADARIRQDAVDATIAASRDQLSPDDGRRFVQLAIFPEETSIPLTTLARLWSLDDMDTADSALRLDDLSLLSLDLRRGSIRLHDVMRVYLTQQLDDPATAHARLVAAYADVLRLPDDYAWRWLAYHMRHAGRIDELRALLLRPEWLRAKLSALGPHALIRDFDYADGDPDLALVQAALKLAIPALAADVDQIFEQLLGRLPVGASERIDSFRSALAQAAPAHRLRARWPNLRSPGSGLTHTFTGHTGWINGVLELPDGRLLSWSRDSSLHVWDVDSGEGRPLLGHDSEVRGALLLPNDSGLSWSRDSTLRVWDLTTGAGRVLAGHDGPVNGAVLLHDGRALSCGTDSTIRVWNLQTGEGMVLDQLDEHPIQVMEMTKTGTQSARTLPPSGIKGPLLLQDGRVLAWKWDTLHIWNVATGETQALAGHKYTVAGVRLAPGNRALSWSTDMTLRLWALATGEAKILEGHSNTIGGAWSLTDGRLLSWSYDSTLRLWDPDAQEVRVLRGHERRVEGAIPLLDDRALSWGDDRTLRIWDLTSGDGRTLATAVSITGMLALPDGRALSWGRDGTLGIWNLTTGARRTLTGHERGITGAQLLADERALSWGADGTLRLWDLQHEQHAARAGHAQRVSGAVLLDDGEAMSWSRDGELRTTDVATGESHALGGHQDAVTGVLSLPAKTALSWSRDGSLRVWDCVSGENRELAGHTKAVTGAVVLRDGRALSWSDDGTLRVWNVTTGECAASSAHGRPIRGAMQLRDDRVVSWSDGMLALWDLRTGQARGLDSHADAVGGVLESPNGQLLSWSDDYTVRVWDLDSNAGRSLRGHRLDVRGVLPLPGRRALSWSDDGTVRLWDLETGDGFILVEHGHAVNGALLLPDDAVVSWSNDHTLAICNFVTSRRWTGHEGWVMGALLATDERVVSWSDDRTVRLWNVSTGKNRILMRHEAEIRGVLRLSDGRLLSWSNDHSVRVMPVEGDEIRGLSFHFDAVPTTVVPCHRAGVFVGDASGRLHFLDVPATNRQ